MKERLQSSRPSNWESKEEESFGKFIFRMRKEINKWSLQALIDRLEEIELPGNQKMKPLSKNRLLRIENDVKKREQLIQLRDSTIKCLAEVLQIPMVVMEAKLNGDPIPWKAVLIDRYGEEKLDQAREIIDDALEISQIANQKLDENSMETDM